MDYKKLQITFSITCTFIMLLFSCPALSQPDSVNSVADPYEPFNRAMYNFNDKLDRFILKPVATVYNKIIPKPLNKGIANFFNNIDTLTTIANDLLQLKFQQAVSDIWRIGINSTIGIAGFFDVATIMKLERHQEDFGLTLARWGYKDSTYLVLPFFGPSTIRDGISIPVDYFAFSVYPYIQPNSVRYGLYTLGVVSRRAQLLPYQQVFEEAALDKYVFMRDAYLQRRASQIKQNAH
jgi:phospholipid-binding lipoprotein MlaA